jgi:class 3 adenylate cyclase/tetratricopeptide (TPR) repeat protein
VSAPRLVTVLFTDLVGSTETVARLGPEAGQAWRLGHLELLREALAGSGGREVQAFGDGLLVVFEAASAAVACAAAMQQRVARANARRDALAETAVRIGLAVGEASEDEEGVHGLVVVEAARLCAAAQGGQILAAALVETLSGGRATQPFTALGTLELKGLPAPVATLEVGWREASEATGVPFPPALAEAASLPFVGRAAEREKLAALWQRAQAGERRVALLAGEPGIGKTRLAAELARSAADAGALVLFGRSDEDLSAPFQPWVQALRHWAAHTGVETLRAELGTDASLLARLLPELSRRLELPAGAHASLDPESDRLAQFEAIDELLASLSRGAPLVVVLDDLHWADKPSLVLLRSLVRSARPAALLLAGTYRETDLTRTHPLAELLADLRREPRVERVLLRGLSPEDVSALVSARGQQEPPAEFVAALHAETDGNPFFVEEVLRHLVESGALRREDGRWTSDRPIEQLGIPEGVREVVGRRLSRLSEVANQALGVAAVIGREFDAALIEAAGGPAGEALLDALDEAAGVRLIAPAPGTFGRFAFAHALVRQTLYEELGTTRRVRLHWRIGEALEKRHGAAPEEQLSAIAHHLCEGALAGDARRAVEVTLRAAERAVALAALEEAIALAARALGILDQAGLEEFEARFRAFLLRGRAESRLDLPGHAASFASAIEIAEKLGRPAWRARAVLESTPVDGDAEADQKTRALLADALAALPPGDSSERCLLLGRLGQSLIVPAAEREPYAAEALAMARRLGGALELERALTARAGLLFGTPRAGELEAIEQELRALGAGFAPHARQYTWSLRPDRASFVAARAQLERALRAGRWPLTALYITNACDLLAQGRFVDARHEAALFRDSVAEVGVGGGALGFAAVVTGARLEEGRLAQHARGVEQFASAAPPAYRAYHGVVAAMHAALGHEEEARRRLADLIADGFAMLVFRGNGWPLALRHMTDAAALLGDETAARALEPELVPYSGLMLVGFTGQTLEGAADRCLGQVLAVQGRHDEACARYERALALEEGFESWALAARTRFWWARALAERGASGDVAEARELLGACLDKTRAFGMAWLSEQAESLAAQLA